jgi:ketosteroid isomerase-like protein
MSEENVEIVRGLYGAWNRGDYAAALALIDPEVDIESARHGSLAKGTYRGHPGLYQLLEDFWNQFDDRRSTVEETAPAGDDVFVSVLFRGRGRGSGIEVEMRHWHVWTLRTGRIVRWRLFSTRREALEAAGLQE